MTVKSADKLDRIQYCQLLLVDLTPARSHPSHHRHQFRRLQHPGDGALLRRGCSRRTGEHRAHSGSIGLAQLVGRDAKEARNDAVSDGVRCGSCSDAALSAACWCIDWCVILGLWNLLHVWQKHIRQMIWNKINTRFKRWNRVSQTANTCGLKTRKRIFNAVHLD